MSKSHQAIAYVYPAFDPDYFNPNGNGINAEVCIDYGFHREVTFKNFNAAQKFLRESGWPYRLHNELKPYDY